jgi:hypothetical protein
VKQILILATSAFSLAAALAWNDTIKLFIDTDIRPYVSRGSGLIASLIYALVVTIIAVLVTLQLTSLLEKLERR